MGDLVARLRENADCKDSEAWRRLDGGQDLCIGAMLANDAADRIEALEAEVARLTGEAAKMLNDADAEYNRLTNNMIEHHAKQVARLLSERDTARAERQQLAEAICGGEDIPGLLAATNVDDLVETARKGHRDHSETIDRMLKAWAERRAMHRRAQKAEGRAARMGWWLGMIQHLIGTKREYYWMDRYIRAGLRLSKPTSGTAFDVMHIVYGADHAKEIRAAKAQGLRLAAQEALRCASDYPTSDGVELGCRRSSDAILAIAARVEDGEEVDRG